MAGTFFHGDNLDVLRVWVPDESIDLIYLDPPFNSDQDFNLPFGADDARPEQVRRAFRDTWWWDEAAARAYEELTKTRVELLPEKLPGIIRALHDFLYPKYRHVMLAYLVNMAIRLVELHRVMKSTGSLYLHCDPTASHYLKMILDSIFGVEHFRNEITWKRSSAHSNAKKYSPVHDVILFYTKSDEYTWNPITARLPQKTIDGWYNNVEPETGRRFNRADLTGSGKRGGESGEPWRGVNPTAKGRHWAIPRSIEVVKEIVGDLGTHEALDALDEAGRIHWPEKKDGVPMFKRYIEEAEGVPALDVITSIRHLHNRSTERTGYPTQKPLALMRHLIEQSSNVGDMVLDPFCGCGTTIVACEQLGRKWLGIDMGEEAIRVLREVRVPTEAPGATFNEVIEPFDETSARRMAKLDPGGYSFQYWAVRKLGGRDVGGKKKKGGDRGIDGEIFIEEFGDAQKRRRILISVKSGGTPQPAWVDQLNSAVVNPVHKAYAGILVVLEKPTKGMKERAREYGTIRSGVAGVHDPYKIQIVTAADLFQLGCGVTLTGHNVTQQESPLLQTMLPFDQRPVKDRGRIMAVVSDTTKAKKKGKPGIVGTAPPAPESAVVLPPDKESPTAEAATPEGGRKKPSTPAPKSRK